MQESAPSLSTPRPAVSPAGVGSTAGTSVTRHLSWRKSGILMALTFSFLQMMNEVGALMSIPLYGQMSADLTLTPSQVTWALMATTLMGSVSIALIAKAGDVFGHRRMMYLCLVLIVVGYGIAALAPNLVTLIAGRALLGITAGQALCVGIMNDRLSVTDRKRAVAFIAAGQAAGVFIGFALGGAFVAAGLTWRHAFVFGGILTLLSLIGFALWGKDSDAMERNRGVKTSIDVGGVLLLGLGLTALCIGISQSMSWGLTSPLTLGFTLGGAVLLAAALSWESKSKDPLLPISDLFSRRLLPAYGVFISMGIPSMLLFNLILGYAMTPTAPVAYGYGLTPLQAAFIFLPEVAAGFLAARLVTRWLALTAAKNVLVGAGLLMLASFLALTLGHTSLWVVVVVVFFYGMAYTALMTTSVSVIAVEAREGKGAGTASIYIAVALAASSIGTAIYSAVAGWGTDPATLSLRPETFTVGFGVASVFTCVAIVCGLFLSRNIKLSQVVEGH
jgi:MFS family permease